MNDRLKEFAEQAGFNSYNYMGGNAKLCEKFAELIIQECIAQAKSVGDLRGATDDMVYGADMAAVQISKHFGVQ